MALLLFFLSCFSILSPIIAVTVSGVSSGGAMAVQYHVAHSSIVSGAGIIAGPPYWCANANAAVATGACLTTPGLISVPALKQATTFAYTTGTIDNPSLLSKTKVWVYSGIKDSVVNSGVVRKTVEYYQNYLPASSITALFNVSSQHAWITSKYGNACTYLGSPFIDNCGLDSAGEIFKFLLGGNLKNPVASIPQNIQVINQKSFIPLVGPDVASLADNAFVYIPSSCKSNPAGCKIHIAFHGCEQSSLYVGDVFYRNSGHNEWAESNNIIVLYPQTKNNTLNPKGCWDWWGYTGTNYATKLAVQIVTVKNMVDHIANGGMLA